MAWTSPMTAVAGSVFTAAQFNQYVRDNLNQTGPALVTGAGQILVATAANALAARTIASASVTTSQNTTSNTYANLSTVGPSVTVTTGTQALVAIFGNVANSGATDSLMGWAVSGASTIPAVDTAALACSASTQAGAIFFQIGLTAGSNTFTAQYRVGSGTGTYGNRTIMVIPL